MEKITVGITTEFITISNLLKYAGVLETGGQAHEAIEAGVVTLNGVIVTEKRISEETDHPWCGKLCGFSCGRHEMPDVFCGDRRRRER